MKYFNYLLVISILLSGCKSNKDSFRSVDEITTQTELKLELKSGFLNYNGQKVETARIDKALPYNNGLILVNYAEKSVYITDLKLNVKKKFYLKEKYEPLVRERFFDAFINKDTLFLADNSLFIKKVNLANGEMKSIFLKGIVYFSRPYYIFFSKNGNLVYTFNCLPNTTKDKIKTGDFVCGAVFNPEGNLVDQLAVPKDIFSHTAIVKERAIYGEFNNKKYIYFEMDKNILVLDSLNNKINQKEFYINKDWTKPQVKDKQMSAYIINTQPLAVYKDNLIQWPPIGNIEKEGRVIIYDKEFNPVKKLYLPGLEKTSFYSYFTCGDKLVVFSGNRNGDEKIYIYDLTNI